MERIRIVANYCAVDFVKRAKDLVTPMEDNHVPLNRVIFAMDNPGDQKEGILLPEHRFDGHVTKYPVYNTHRTVKKKSIFGIKLHGAILPGRAKIGERRTRRHHARKA